MVNRRKQITDLELQFDEQRRAFITICAVLGVMVILMVIFGAIVSHITAIIGITLALLWVGSLGRELHRKSSLLKQAQRQYARLEHISEMESAMGYTPHARLPWEDGVQLES